MFQIGTNPSTKLTYSGPLDTMCKLCELMASGSRFVLVAEGTSAYITGQDVLVDVGCSAWRIVRTLRP